MKISDIRLWNVYFSPNCYHAKPDPKDKFVVVVGVTGDDIWGFLINSEITPLVKNNPELLVCEADILATEHDYLKRDSIVDCHTIYSFQAWDFRSRRGAISDDAKQSILDAVRDCKTIERRHKKMILENAE